MKKRKEPAPPKIVIGRKDLVDLPDLRLFDVQAKIDTGAYTSAIHCTRIKEMVEDGRRYITFHVPHARVEGQRDPVFRTAQFSLKNIRSSTGHLERRYVIVTHLQLFGKLYQTEFSLSDRSQMRNPILLGRKLLTRRFVVDVARKDLSYRHKTTMGASGSPPLAAGSSPQP